MERQVELCNEKRSADGKKKCTSQQICNPDSGRCVSRKGKKGKEILGKLKKKSPKRKSPSRKKKSPKRKSKKKSPKRKSPKRKSPKRKSPSRKKKSPKGKKKSPKRKPRRKKKHCMDHGCPDDKICNPDTGNCVLKRGKKGKEILKRMKASPKRKSPTPRRKSPTPRRKSPTPRRKSPTPRRKSPTPRRKSPTPRRKSPTPRRKSPTPRRKSPTPRRKSPTPKRKSVLDIAFKGIKPLKIIPDKLQDAGNSVAMMFIRDPKELHTHNLLSDDYKISSIYNPECIKRIRRLSESELKKFEMSMAGEEDFEKIQNNLLSAYPQLKILHVEYGRVPRDTDLLKLIRLLIILETLKINGVNIGKTENYFINLNNVEKELSELMKYIEKNKGEFSFTDMYLATGISFTDMFQESEEISDLLTYRFSQVFFDKIMQIQRELHGLEDDEDMY